MIFENQCTIYAKLFEMGTLYVLKSMTFAQLNNIYTPYTVYTYTLKYKAITHNNIWTSSLIEKKKLTEINTVFSFTEFRLLINYLWLVNVIF